MKITKGVIVAAGRSSRLYPLTLEKPKVLLEVGGRPLISRSMDLLCENGITDIAVVAGYKKEMLAEHLLNYRQNCTRNDGKNDGQNYGGREGRAVVLIPNPFYAHCNNMGSLWFARDFVNGEPFVYLHGDIIYHPRILQQSLKHFLDNNNDIELVTDFETVDEEAMKVRVDRNNYLIESNKDIPLKEAAGEWIGITYVRNPQPLFACIETIMFNEGLAYYDTKAFTRLAREGGARIFCSSTGNFPWVEIDFPEDLQQARKIFRETD